jgi:polysaccharide pyruvyl transferase WcaK-like protein
MIGHFAASDRENYGDLLYPVIVGKMLESRGYGEELRYYSFLDGPAPGDSGYTITRIKELLEAKEKIVSALLIGGGDILRTDTITLASHYKYIYRQRIGHPILQWFGEKYLKRPTVVEKFLQQYMNYSAPGPFLLDQKDFPGIGSAYFCSCGAPLAFAAAEKSRVRDVLENAAYLSVRDRQSREKILAAGVTREIHAVPDLIMTLSDFYEPARERSKGQQILRSYGVDTGKKIVTFQCMPHAGEPIDEIVAQLSRYRERTGAEIVLLPLGYCHADDRFLKRLCRESAGAFRYLGVRSIFDMLSVLAASDLFIGTSMHGNITALSYGIPHLFGPIQVDKAEGFLDMVDLSTDFKLSSWQEINDKADMVTSLDTDFFSIRAAQAKKEAHAAFDILYSSLSANAAC